MSGYPIENNFLRTVKIEQVCVEGPKVKTFSFNDKQCAKSKPGQFAMIWLPGIDEIPMSISAAYPSGSTSITVGKVGEATDVLHRKKRGDFIGVRGPFGNSFRPVNGRVMLAGGGTGIAPLIFLAQKLTKLKAKPTFLLGAKRKQELLFLQRIESIFPETETEIFTATEDGSHGHRGVVTELAAKILDERKFDMVYACGKEQMLQKLFLLTEKFETPMQASLERIMRCAIGLCGSCTIGMYRVCSDGPVFTSKQLRAVIDEFGQFKRDFNGTRIQL